MRLCSPNFSTTYLEYTHVQESPDLFHWLCSQVLLSLATHGARYLDFGHFKVYPNIYGLLLAKTAQCRKGGATDIFMDIAEEAGLINSDAMSEKITEAALWNQGQENIDLYGNSTILVYSDELSLTLSKHEAYSGLIPFLTKFYTARRGSYSKKTASQDKVILLNPFVVTLLATNPKDFADLIPAAASSTGFTPRLLLVYQEEPKGLITYPQAPADLRLKIVGDLKAISRECDPNHPKAYELSADARKWYDVWYRERLGKSRDPELDGWYGRKHSHLLKLSLLQALSETDALVIEQWHMEIALKILEKIEFYLGKVYKLIGQIPMAAHGERIMDQLARNGKWLSRSELQHMNSNRMRAVELSEVLCGLEMEGRIEKAPIGLAMYYGLKGTKRKE
jgi:hypothetical protein